MRCHGLHADNAQGMVHSDVKPSFPVGAGGIPSAFPALHLRHGSFLSIQFRSVSPAAGSPCGGTLFRAYRARAGAPVSAGAVRAPDCARETADAPVPSVPAGAFLQPQPPSCAEKRKGGPGSRLSILILPQIFLCQICFRIKSKNMNKSLAAKASSGRDRRRCREDELRNRGNARRTVPQPVQTG